MRRLLAKLTAVVLLGPTPLLAGAERVVLVPFENLSGSSEARDQLEALAGAYLQGRGYTVLAGGEVAAYLEARRIRYLDSLGAAERSRLLEAHQAGAVMTGKIFDFAEARVPLVSLSARLQGEDGRVLWSDVVALSAADTEGVFGGRVATRDGLAREAAERLFEDLPAPGDGPAPTRLSGRPRRLSAPRTYRAASLEKGTSRRVCVLPFVNHSTERDAPRIVADLLSRRLQQTGEFEVVEPAELRSALVAEQLRSFQDRDPLRLARLGEGVGGCLFLRGTVFAYQPGLAAGAAQPPQVALHVSLVDVAASRVLWSSDHSRKGDQYTSFFMRGAIVTAVGLADRVVSEMVDALLKAKPDPAARPRRASAKGL
jgi:hypothetical protein